MMRALIDPRDNRVTQVEAQDFPVAPPLFWVDVPGNVSAETHEWNGSSVVPVPVLPAIPDPGAPPHDRLDELAQALIDKGLVTEQDLPPNARPRPGRGRP